MSDHSAGTGRRPRRTKLRVLVLVGVLVGALGISAPALALIGITLPIPSAGNPTTTVTTHVEDNTGTDITPNKSLDLSGLNATGIAGITNLAGGLTQTTSTLTQLLAGVKKGLGVAAPFAQAHATAAAATAISNFQTRAQATAAAALALDPQEASGQVMGNLTDLQSQALGEVAGVLPLALTTGLQVVQDIVSPVCSLTAVPSSLLPGVGIDATRAYTSVAPGIQQTDVATNKLITDTYGQVYDGVLASVGNIPNVGPVASALISLLKFNWNTTYTPPGGGAPVVHSTKALIDVPTPIDVDGSGGFDLCGTLTFALEGSGSSITGIKFTQTITKMPLANPVLPVDITGGLLNVLNFGYDTTESTVPIVYTTSATVDLTGLKVNLDNTYSVHRGKNLVIPPLSLAALGTTGLPTFPPLLTDAPKPTVTQKICIGACSALALTYRYENVPTTTHVDAPLLPLTGTKVNYQGAQTSDSFTYKLQAGASTAFATVVGRDRTAPEVATPSSPSAPTSVQWCYNFADGSCNPAGVTTDKSSIGIQTSSPTFVENYLQTGAAVPTTCTSSTTYDSHITTTGNFAESHTPGTTAVGVGRLAVDTAGKPADGCVGMIAGAALGSEPPSLTMPVGFTADKRVATYHTTNLGTIILGVTPDSKTGTITCPAGTSAVWTTITGAIGTPNLAPIICSLPPVNTVAPAISGQTYQGAVLTTSNGTWTPGSPNAPTYTYQWSRCDAAGASCAPIAGATASTYTGTAADLGSTLRSTVTGKNLDGQASATSAQTAKVTLPPAPTVLTAPVLGANRKVGVATTTTNGTYNNGASSFTYQWQRCDAAGTPASCADIAGATASSYTVQSADKGLTIRIAVNASNIGGSAPTNYSATAFIPPSPVNNTLPGIKNGPSNAVGASVLTGDNLTATNGTWQYTTTPFTYQWQRCDADGTSGCVDIAGATSGSYAVSHPADDGATLRVVVTGHGLNGDTTATSGATGVVVFNDLSAKPVTDVPDGTVNATVAGASGSSFVGGSFDTVGKPTGGAAAAGTAGAGAVSAAALTAGGNVNATLPDGSGGYYLGGAFTTVKSLACPGFAHINSDGTLDQSYCQSGLTGEVRALSQITAAGSSKLIAVGGLFTNAGHDNLLFLDPAAPGSPLYAGDGDPNGAVNAISNNTAAAFYLGGDFSQVGGTPAGRLAMETVSPATGSATGVARSTTAWPAAVCTGAPNADGTCPGSSGASVKAVTYTALGVLIGGDFDSAYKTSAVATSVRKNAAAFGLTTAANILGWAPNTNGTVRAIAAPPAPSSGLQALGPFTIYVGGDFTTIGSASLARPYLAEFGISLTGASASAGANNNSAPSTSFNPQPNGPVTALAVSGVTGGPTTAPTSTLSVGGKFTSIFGSVRHRLAGISGQGAGTSTPATLDSWNPNAGQDVLALTRDNTNAKAFVGGAFNVVGGTTRNNLAEIDPSTGVTSWNPGTDGAVKALAVKAGNVYVGGTFATAGGSARSNVAAIDGSGNATSWNPGANGSVNAIDTSTATTYLGGAFSSAGGAARANLAGIDGSGVATAWNPGADGAVKALTVNGGTVYVGGTFANAGGAARTNVAAIDGSGAATGFAPNADGAVNAIAVNSAGVYLGGAFTHLGPDARDHVALADPATGAAAAWNPGVNGPVSSLFLFGSSVFTGGQFSTAGGASRANLAALDAGSDAAQGFAPDPNGAIRSLTRTSSGSLTVGGSQTVVAGTVSPGVAFFGG